MNQSKQQLIGLLKENRVIKFGKFKLSSGKESDYYVDMKKAVTNPLILQQVAEIISNRINKNSVDKIAGPALGAIPIVTAVSIYTGIPMLMIRKSKKNYGTSQLIEGDINEGDRVLVLEDVTTTGNSLKDAINAILDSGGKVAGAFVIVDRAEGALESFKKEGMDFEPLLTVDELR